MEFVGHRGEAGMMASVLRRLFGQRRESSTPAELEPHNITVMRRYAELARAAGIDRLYLVLTFDCDTDLDIDAAPALDRDLRRRGIHAGYAVPGVQLEKGATAWRQIADAGAEFLNHGARAHAEFRDGRYWPITFYDKLSEAEVVADVTRGHELVTAIVGAAPVGFRAPHFGSFQEAAQLRLLYRTLQPLGYRYCSTTIPAMALTRGPVVAVDGMFELPTMGSYRNPETLLDSWTYLVDRTNYALGGEYFELFEETVRRMSELRMPGLLTYYADPSHVVGQAPFERALDVIDRFQIPTLHGRAAVERFGARVASHR
jgi:peptidoglycan/xylan/chitin deacetylase (PgdA/CDA1 family)